MALAVLTLAPGAVLAGDQRVLGAREWQAVNTLAQLREQAEAALAQAQQRAMAEAAEHARAQLAAAETRLHKTLLLKTLALQVEYERQLRELRSRMVDTVMACLDSMLMPPPPQLFARVQASIAAMVGESAEIALHLSAADEAAARAALAQLPMVRIVVHPDLAAGQCFADTRFGRIQAGLSTQLEALREALQSWWASEQSVAHPVTHPGAQAGASG